jgi:hypothetical protein
MGGSRIDVPASSRPMLKVRDDLDTPWTIDMLPASRLDSCARNRVGRRSFISRSLSTPDLASARAVKIAASTSRSRSPPPAATIMSVRARISLLSLMPAESSASPAA